MLLYQVIVKMFTSYLGQLKKLDSYKKICIMRYPPKWLIPYFNSNDFLWLPILAPTKESFSSYKKTLDFNKLKLDYLNEINLNIEMYLTIHLFLSILEESNNEEWVLLCTEKELLQCHRSILSYYLNKINIETKELIF